MNSMTECRAFLRTKRNNREKADRWPQVLRLGVAFALTVASVACAQTYTVLKSFTGSDGAEPYGELVLAGSTFYGTTSQGGISNLGVVFKVNMDGSGYAVLKYFTGSDGSGPTAGLVLGGSTLYGATQCGGSSDHGVVFRVNMDGSGYTVLKNFTGGDGGVPTAGLVLGGSTLYGTTQRGGSSDHGVVFRVNMDGSGYAVLKHFTGSDGTWLDADLVLAGNTLYGTTYYGGSWNYGVVFKVNTDGSGYSVLKNFTPSDVREGEAGLVLAGSTLYGAAMQGGSSDCGAVFKVSTDGTGFAVLKSFGGADGTLPFGGLVWVGSTLYGTTQWGGISNGGVVFKLNTDGSDYAVLKNFTGSDGWNPYARLVLAGGTLYGSTRFGGNYNLGVVFGLAVLSPPITAQPLTQTAEAGTTARFRVAVTNTPPEPTYQWYFNGANALAGGTNAQLDVTNVQPVDAGAYTVVVRNVVGSVTSNPALLGVIPPVPRQTVPAIGLTGGTGDVLNVDYADSLSPAPNWTPLGSVSLTSTPQYCFDLAVPLLPQRFYRAWQTGAPGVRPSLDLHLVPAITLTGTIGHSVRLDYIDRFGPIDAWVTLATVPLTNSSQLYFDTSSIGRPARLWRIVPVP